MPEQEPSDDAETSRMREERGQLDGDQVVREPMELFGTVMGNVRVIEGAKFYMRGKIIGDLDVEAGGRVHVFGSVTGDLRVHEEAKVIHSGVIGGDAINLGGRLFINIGGTVVGKIRPRAGKTRVEKRGGSR